MFNPIKQKKSSHVQHDQPFFDFQSENQFFGNSQFFNAAQGKFDGTAQREAAPEEEEAMQGKFDGTAQREAAPEEEEAMQGKFDGTAQREAAPEEEEQLQGKFDATAQREAAPEEEEAMQGKFAQLKCDACEQEEAQAKTETTTQAKSDAPNGLSGDVRGKMENSFGADFSGVNIHTNSLQAKEIGALAYTQGSDVHFAPGQYNPETQSGQELLGHELTHVVQQREGRVEPTTQVNGMPVNDNHGLENEADTLGAKAAAGEVISEKKE
jgi:hypothetical protein